MWITLIGVLAQVADSILSQAVKSKAPQEIIDSLLKVTDAVAAAHATAVTKSQLEAQRG